MSSECVKYCPFTSQPCWEGECELWDEEETACIFYSIAALLYSIENILKGQGQQE